MCVCVCVCVCVGVWHRWPWFNRTAAPTRNGNVHGRKQRFFGADDLLQDEQHPLQHRRRLPTFRSTQTHTLCQHHTPDLLGLHCNLLCRGRGGSKGVKHQTWRRPSNIRRGDDRDDSGGTHQLAKAMGIVHHAVVHHRSDPCHSHLVPTGSMEQVLQGHKHTTPHANISNVEAPPGLEGSPTTYPKARGETLRPHHVLTSSMVATACIPQHLQHHPSPHGHRTANQSKTTTACPTCPM